MRQRRLIPPVLAAACLLPFAPAYAQQPDNTLTGYVALMSSYIGRGLSQSVGQPSIQAELDYNNTGAGLYAGMDGTSINWIDQLYPGDSVSLEADGYAGYRWFAGDWAYKCGLLRMQFPGHYVPQTPPAARPDTTEVFSFIGWRNLSAKLNYAVTDSFGAPDSRGSWYLDLSVTQPVGN
ncbi:MAG: TorF family putative porin, partial [Gammaproteobacteria bacterium]